MTLFFSDLLRLKRDTISKNVKNLEEDKEVLSPLGYIGTAPTWLGDETNLGSMIDICLSCCMSNIRGHHACFNEFCALSARW